MAKAPRIVLLHATPIAVAPVQDAFASTWPQAEIVNLLDDGLTIDRLTASMSRAAVAVRATVATPTRG